MTFDQPVVKYDSSHGEDFNLFGLKGNWRLKNSPSVSKQAKNIFDYSSRSEKPIITNALFRIQVLLWIWFHQKWLQRKGIISHNHILRAVFCLLMVLEVEEQLLHHFQVLCRTRYDSIRLHPRLVQYFQHYTR